MLIKIVICLWAPLLLVLLSIICILKPLKIKGALVLKAATKNEHTWNYSQRFYSMFLLPLSLIYLILASIVLQKVLLDEITLHSAQYIAWISPLIALIPVPFTELALRLRFDSEGNRKRNRKV